MTKAPHVLIHTPNIVFPILSVPVPVNVQWRVYDSGQLIELIYMCLYLNKSCLCPRAGIKMMHAYWLCHVLVRKKWNDKKQAGIVTRHEGVVCEKPVVYLFGNALNWSAPSSCIFLCCLQLIQVMTSSSINYRSTVLMRFVFTVIPSFWATPNITSSPFLFKKSLWNVNWHWNPLRHIIFCLCLLCGARV